jgi:hypothetical protein
MVKRYTLMKGKYVKPNFSTYNLLKFIGSPYERIDVLPNYIPEVTYDFASKNRIRLLYLNALAKHQKIFSLQFERDKLLEKYQEIQRAFTRIANLFGEAKINYAFFKSIRPYEEVTSDIDILVFGSQYERVLKAMNNAGYGCLGRGPLSTTFQDKESQIGLDIYEDVGVSHIIYMDKNKLQDYCIEVDVLGSCSGKALSPEADLLAVIAHSTIKEQLYVLSEYYTTLYYLKDSKNFNLTSFASLSKQCNLLISAQVHLSITGLLHYSVHGFIPEQIIRLLRMLNANSGFEQARVAKIGMTMPYKYHPATIARVFAEKLEEKKARKSFAIQMTSMLNPEFSFSFSKLALKHVFRETY